MQQKNFLISSSGPMMVGAAWDKGERNKGFPVPKGKGKGKGKDKKGPNQWIDRTNTTQQGQSWFELPVGSGIEGFFAKGQRKVSEER